MGNFKDAEGVLKKALLEAPENSRSHYLLGVTYYWQGRDEEARDALDSTAKLDPKNSRARHYLGVVSARLGEIDKAEVAFTEAIEIDPEYGDAHFNLAVLYATGAEPAMEKARQHYERAVDLGSQPDARMEELLSASASAGSGRIPDEIEA